VNFEHTSAPFSDNRKDKNQGVERKTDEPKKNSPISAKTKPEIRTFLQRSCRLTLFQVMKNETVD
jgi:hypothetical protein